MLSAPDETIDNSDPIMNAETVNSTRNSSCSVVGEEGIARTRRFGDDRRVRIEFNQDE